jgi:hypothetical protein
MITKNFSNKTKIPNNLDPNWITGFTDAEGCFTVIISKRSTSNWRVQVSFEINLHKKDIMILHLIKEFCDVGLISSSLNRNKCVYRVTKIEDLINVIIPHFITYPLLTQKYSDFLLWVKVIKIMSKKEHLIPSEFNTILRYYTSINKGLSATVKAYFPKILAVDRDKVKLPDKLNPYWVSGFTAGDGCFFIGIREKTGKIYFSFFITQHSRDLYLMNLFVKFFGCGNVRKRTNTDRCDYYIQEFKNIYEYILPHFKKYPLCNIKTLDFLDFNKAAELFKFESRNSKKSVREIISNMKSRRDN